MYRQLDGKACHTEAPPTVGSFHLESSNDYTCLRCCSYYVPDNVSIELWQKAGENQQNSATGQFVNEAFGVMGLLGENGLCCLEASALFSSSQVHPTPL